MDLIEQLDHVFKPRAVAVIGASANPQKPGFMCTNSLVNDGFKGKVYPVNPGLTELLGLPAYPSVLDVPGEVDLAIIVVPAKQTIPAVEECIEKGVKGAVLVSAGFSEVGSEIGLDLQSRLRDVANKGGIRIIGPNTLGLINPGANLNATFSPGLGFSKTGNVAVASQSGGMCVYLVNALTGNNVGVSKVMGMGNRCNLDFDDVVTYFTQDKETGVIVLYIEGVEQPKKLMKVTREVVKQKPVVVYKGGRTEGSNTATLSHTGALAGKYELYKAAFSQGGMIVVESMTELADVAKALSFQPPSAGNRIAVLSLQAGPGIIIADKCRELGLRMAEFSPATRQRLRQLISPLLSIENPVDMAWTGSNFDTSREILSAVLEDDGVDALVVAFISFELSMELPKAMIDVTGRYKKPVAVCLGSLGAAEGVIKELEDASIPTYPFPDRAITGLAGLVKYGEILKTVG
jgi:acyl-CoA synthetase (NDP forming)